MHDLPWLLQLALRVVEGASGLAILVAALYVLAGYERREISARSVAVLLIALGAAGRVANAISPEVDDLFTLPLPAGVALWIALAVQVQQGLPMRRVYDWMCLGKRRGDARRRREAMRTAAQREGDER